MRRVYGQAIIDALKAGTPDAVAQAIAFLRDNLTAAALAGCHHCGEGERPADDEEACWWCGLRDKPRSPDA